MEAPLLIGGDMKSIHILITGVGRRVELVQAFRQAALKLEIDLKLYGADMTGTAPALAYCDYIRKVCAMNAPQYIDQLIEICINDKVDLVIPTIDTDLLILSQNKKKFENIGTKVLISDPDKILICRDKNKTGSFFELCGLKAPKTYNDYQKYIGPYPCFIKPKDGSSSINAFKVDNKEELAVYAEQIEGYVIQPFISGTEFTIDIFCDFYGNPIYITPRKRIQVRAGEVLKTQICMDRIMIHEAKELCKVFKPCGPMTVQLIRNVETQEDYFIEINPRYGGGAPLSMKAGARSAEIVLKLIINKTVSYSEPAIDATIYSRFDQSVCIKKGKHSLGNIKGVIFDLDDTLYSEKEYVKSGYNAIAEYLGNEAYADILWGYFQTGKPAIDELLKNINQENKKNEILNIYRTHMPHIKLYDGVSALIKSLKNRGLKVGLITDGRSKSQRNKITALKLENLFDDIIVTDELGGVQFRKPNDISFRILQCKWRMSFEDMIYVGDNFEKDFIAPKQLGMQYVWVNNPQGLYQTVGESENMVNSIPEVGMLLNKYCI